MTDIVCRSCGHGALATVFDALVTHARLGTPQPIVARQTQLDLSALADSVDHWRRWAGELDEHGRRAAVWAAGSKAVAFLPALPDFAPVVAVDINPAKAGRHLPGAGLRVCGPDDLPGYDVDTVVMMNPVYTDEIRAELDRVGVHAELVGLGA